MVDALSAQIASGGIGHAYLFAGSRGLGKTSIARIFAREIGTTERDLYEMDAASTNGVDDIRELTENVYTLPFESKYKVYILDEAHMLSKGAWNAFLKTLEEPPAHALFILATTELERVPDTVQSRCQVFTFKKPSREGLVRLVLEVAKKEGYKMEPSAADLVALLADGSYRDALSILEKALSVSKDKDITREEAERATGTPRSELVHAFVAALSEGNKEGALVAVSRAVDAGVDMALYLSLVVEYARQVLLLRHAPELEKELTLELGEAAEDAKALAKASGSKLNHVSMKALLDAAARIRYVSVPAFALELAVLELFPE